MTFIVEHSTGYYPVYESGNYVDLLAEGYHEMSAENLELAEAYWPIVSETMGKWQVCPICSGVGTVSSGYYNRAGDNSTWVDTGAMSEICRTCQGLGIIEASR